MRSQHVSKGAAVMSLALAGMVLSGCSKPPSADLEAATAALASATAAEAQEYAQASFAGIEDLQAQLDSELKIQSEKSAFTRSYDHAKELATEIKANADAVAMEAVQAKESVHMETTALLQEVKLSMEEVQTMLTTAPKGKGSAMDLAALQGDLDTAKATLAEGEAEFNNGKYMVAKTKILAAQSGAQTVKSAIETAISARSGRAGGN
jgi:hypothetical protein